MENIELDNIVSNETDDIVLDNTTNLDITDSSEDVIEAPSESVDIQIEDANTTNCLALTIQEDHKLVAVKNVFIHSIRMSWKVIVSTITLAIIKLLT